MATVQQPKKVARGKVSPERWDEWTRYLAKRTKPVPLTKLLGTKHASPLEWELPAEARNSETEALLARLRGFKSRRATQAVEIAAELEPWLEAARVRSASVCFALETLAWCHALPVLAGALPAAPWSQLVDQLVNIAAEASKCDLSADPLTQQLLAGELPLSLAYLFPELPACKALAEPARQALSLGLTELLDGEGMPHAKYLDAARGLFACWTRCQAMGRKMKRHPFSKDAKVQYEWLLRQMLRLCRPDGTQVLSSAEPNKWSAALFEAAVSLVGDAEDREIANRILPGHKSPRAQRTKLPVPATNSEWGELAVLRRGWERASDQLTVRYANRDLQLELNCGSEIVFSGRCNPELRVHGELLALDQDWEEVCWHSDKDLDYLELEGRFANGWKLQRQMLLAREDRFLLLADAVLGESEADIIHQFTLPLCDGITFAPADETREGILQGTRPIAAVLPLQLPEWRAERDAGALEATDGGLCLRQQTRGRCLFAPLFIDLKPKRFSHQVTWRRLTVAQQLQILRPDVAVGYRVQCSDRQWVVYRSLDRVASRSVLGQHVSSEFVVGQFSADGEFEQLIEIE